MLRTPMGTVLPDRIPVPVSEAGRAAAADRSPRYRERLVALALPEDLTERRVAVAAAVEGWLREEGIGSHDERSALLCELVDDLAGLGPLEPLLADPNVTEILVNGVERIRVEVDGRLLDTPFHFRDADQLRGVIDRILVGSGRRIDDGAPMVDARLQDGSRLNAVLPPVAVGAPLVTLRRPPNRRRGFQELIASGSLDNRIAAFLHAAVLGECNLIVCGGTGAGKTTLLAALVALVPPEERVVVLEDVSELCIDHPHQARLECRPPGRDGGGEVVLRDLVRNSLRMRPDRIVVGEVRGPEAADMVAAMNTGHHGSMATLHANSARDALRRLEGMLAMAWPALGERQPRRWIASAVDVIVHCDRDPTGRRFVGEVAVVDHDDGGELCATALFEYDGLAAARATGEVPRRCLERMASNGVPFPPSMFAR
jgi:pilus assembly protein CpaF